MKTPAGYPCPSLPEAETPIEATSLESIVKSATSTPIFFDEDEDELLPLINPPQNDPAPIANPIIPQAKVSIPQKNPGCWSFKT